ncbi:MAG TPA: metallophosphoesterase, partial [Bacteroidota bacterium]|nr:metallophosphoesterase [Bacteroidota bacterium]
ALKRNQNERATRMLFDHILADSTYKAVFNFGDVTAHSASEKAWEFMDSVMTRAEQRRLSMYAAIGNHDYFFSAEEGERNFKKRFPDFRRTGNVVKIKNSAFVLFNSNFTRLSKTEQQTQLAWYKTTLDSLERDSTVINVFVGCHHPPYTNNTMVSGSADVRNLYVPPFIQHNKCKLFLSGHAHAFEHFKKFGKDFLVLGGGGGIQHTLLLGDQQREKDLFPLQTEKRMFHYLRCEITRQQIQISVMMIRKDFSGIDPVYTFTIPK